MKKVLVTLCCWLVGASGWVMADSPETLIKQNLKMVDSRIQVESVSPSQVGGMFEVVLNSGEVLYSDAQGEYFMVGKLYRYSKERGFVNLTENKAKQERLDKLATIATENKVIFAPKGAVKATLNVFTDVDCAYCRKLHQEMPKYNELGIQVNYLAFPRNGQNSKTFDTMVSVWCAEGEEAKREAMDQAKQGMNLAKKTCDNPVLQQLNLGRSIGVTGTPAMVLEDGTLLPGYVPAKRLAQQLGIN